MRQLLALVLGAILLVLGFMFSLVLLVIAALVGLAGFGYFWWRTRALRKAMREHTVDGTPAGQVIEGEAVLVETDQDDEHVVLPRDLPGK